MNRTKIKNYAPQARRDFLQAVTDRAAHLGLTEDGIEPVKVQGDLALIGGRAFPRAVAEKRKRLEEQVRSRGFGQAMEGLAYTWFNRMVALRFMELHGYLDHGYRVLSHPDADKTDPEILEHAEHVELPGLNRQKVIDLKLESNKEAELYRLLLIAQCNALSSALPFLFERIDDETELVLPDNLLHSDSIIRTLVAGIDEEDWQEVEIIGWIYQFYISEKKDKVIGKVVASQDIPAATQLFTPNWIVKYLVQNTIGRQWLATYPDSPLRKQMEFYIEPAEQTHEVREQQLALTPTSLNPEEMTLLDPACGSGHILVEAYDLFKAIYQERGYRARDIPALILTKNLFGLEIDDRAAQLAAFALVMKARADDRRILKDEGKVRPNVLTIQESKGLHAGDVTEALNAPILKEELPHSGYLFEEAAEADSPLFTRKTLGQQGHVAQADVASLLELFEDAKTFGSLIRVPPKLAAKLPEIEQRARDVARHGDLITQTAAKAMLPLVEQGGLLARQFAAVVTNPPYMGTKGLNGLLKPFLKTHYPCGKADLYSAFVERLCAFTTHGSFVGAMTPFTWMFLGTFEKYRTEVIGRMAIQSLVRPEYHAFFESAYVPICAFVLNNTTARATGTYIDLTQFYGESLQPIKTLEAIRTPGCSWVHYASQTDFALIPGAPIAYWVNGTLAEVFRQSPALTTVAEPKVGLQTGNNDRFLRFWYEVDAARIGLNCQSRELAQQGGYKWFPCNKGGPYRKWYGNNQYIVDWENDGREMRALVPSAVIRNPSFYFREGITWSTVSSSLASFRYSEAGRMFESKGAMCFPKSPHSLPLILALLNSCVINELLKIFSPTLDYHEGPLGKLPVAGVSDPGVGDVIKRSSQAIELAKEDEASDEVSHSFSSHPLLLRCGSEHRYISQGFDDWVTHCSSLHDSMRRIEEANNRHFIEAYGLTDRLSPNIPDDQITLYRPDRVEDIKRLLSYAIGCMMGRYSLDKPGLIYAHRGNVGFDPSQYTTFPADDDGIVPLLESDWGIRDDATNRIVDFIGVAWPREGLEENLKFIADSLGPTKDERPRETIRRYLATGFYKDHLRWYKRRPIYWLFSSGKQRAFQALVYLHRYNEGTLARMRTEYVIPLLGRIATRIEQLETDKTGATSTSHRRALQKEQDLLQRQQTELQAYDEKLRHYADQRIKLDLDDGVKVNYGKFGDLLAEVKAICGSKDED